MLIPMADLVARFDMRPECIVHAGCHLAEEKDAYRDAGATDVLWIEAHPGLAARAADILIEYPGQRVVNACLGASTGERVTFHVTEANDGSMSNDGMSSSVLELGTHRTAHPEVVVVDEIEMETITLDEVVATHAADFLLSDRLAVLADLQGLEGEVFQGAYNVLTAAKWVYAEVSMDEVYAHQMKFPELEQLLMSHGFEAVEVKLAGCQHRDCRSGSPRWVGWGDAAFMRADSPTTYVSRHPECEDWYR